MKRNHLLPGFFLIVIGLYFLLKQFNISFPYSHLIFTWQSILLILGLVFAFQGFSNRDEHKMFSGIIMLGLGVYFHSIHHFHFLNAHWGYFTLIISIAFFMKYFVNKRDGIVPGMILLIISLIALNAGNVTQWFNIFTKFNNFWPVLLIFVGIYLVFFRKK
ncbi:hypothetical protein SAMN05421736_105228 [Evansella caseinilytica]|uniref:LiaI-LiaF-like transmembrane region domain-containing protein n=1 Tax=Evansella caseinilytica TaxID=1503961 RepID=A0A1H3PVP0_9BACI|nr:DUF5668 domain-containing protein [Evansella caseinilytica]SDZ05050.1 hypothetical protein SAMN05421736_105228 [Evansella caseinilytica]